MSTTTIKVPLRILGLVSFALSGLLFFIAYVGNVPVALFFGAALLVISIYLAIGAPHLVRAIDQFFRTESIYEPGVAFTQRGGIRCGRSFWFASNSSTPFAHLRVSKEELILGVSFFGMGKRIFIFPRSSVRRLVWRRKLFSLGLQIEHDVAEFPVFMLFWVSNREELTQGLSDFGYFVSDM